jgi:hypothetical protein
VAIIITLKVIKQELARANCSPESSRPTKESHLTVICRRILLLNRLEYNPGDMQNKQPPTNFRKTRRDQERTLVILVMLALVIVGSGLIWLIWGANAALLGGLCLLGGAVLIGGLWLLLGLIQKLVGE